MDERYERNDLWVLLVVLIAFIGFVALVYVAIKSTPIQSTPKKMTCVVSEIEMEKK